MNTGIKPATGRVQYHPWIDPGQSQIWSCTIHVCLSARSAALLGGATCHGPEHLVRSCWLCVECKALAVLESGELGEIMSLSRKRVVLPVAINREVFLGCTHTLWVCSIHLAHRCCPHRTWETKESDTNTILPLLVPGVSCLLQHPWDGSRQMSKFVRRLTSQTLPFSCTTLQTHWPLPFCSSGTQLTPVFRILFFLFPSCEMLRPKVFTWPPLTFLQPQVACHLLSKAFLHYPIRSPSIPSPILLSSSQFLLSHVISQLFV